MYSQILNSKHEIEKYENDNQAANADGPVPRYANIIYLKHNSNAGEKDTYPVAKKINYYLWGIDPKNQREINHENRKRKETDKAIQEEKQINVNNAIEKQKDAQQTRHAAIEVQETEIVHVDESKQKSKRAKMNVDLEQKHNAIQHEEQDLRDNGSVKA